MVEAAGLAFQQRQVVDGIEEILLPVPRSIIVPSLRASINSVSRRRSRIVV
jgi:hypothetical protein